MQWLYYILGTIVLIYLLNLYLKSPTPANKKGTRLGENLDIKSEVSDGSKNDSGPSNTKPN